VNGNANAMAMGGPKPGKMPMTNPSTMPLMSSATLSGCARCASARVSALKSAYIAQSSATPSTRVNRSAMSALRIHTAA